MRTFGSLAAGSAPAADGAGGDADCSAGSVRTGARARPRRAGLAVLGSGSSQARKGRGRDSTVSTAERLRRGSTGCGFAVGGAEADAQAKPPQRAAHCATHRRAPRRAMSIRPWPRRMAGPPASRVRGQPRRTLSSGLADALRPTPQPELVGEEADGHRQRACHRVPEPAAASMAPRAMPRMPSSTCETISSICRRYGHEGLDGVVHGNDGVDHRHDAGHVQQAHQPAHRTVDDACADPADDAVDDRVPQVASWLCILSHSAAGPCVTSRLTKRHTPVAMPSIVRSRATPRASRRSSLAQMRCAVTPSTSSTKPRIERSEKSAGGVMPASRTCHQPASDAAEQVRQDVAEETPEAGTHGTQQIERKPIGLVRMSPMAVAALRRHLRHQLRRTPSTPSTAWKKLHAARAMSHRRTPARRMRIAVACTRGHSVDR